LPFALSRWANSRSGPGTRATASAAMYSARRTSRRPPRMCRSPRRRPLSAANGATPARAASLPGDQFHRESTRPRFRRDRAYHHPPPTRPTPHRPDGKGGRSTAAEAHLPGDRRDAGGVRQHRDEAAAEGAEGGGLILCRCFTGPAGRGIISASKQIVRLAVRLGICCGLLALALAVLCLAVFCVSLVAHRLLTQLQQTIREAIMNTTKTICQHVSDLLGSMRTCTPSR
jgi:hypothetical protein